MTTEVSKRGKTERESDSSSHVPSPLCHAGSIITEPVRFLGPHEMWRYLQGPLFVKLSQELFHLNFSSSPLAVLVIWFLLLTHFDKATPYLYVSHLFISTMGEDST